MTLEEQIKLKLSDAFEPMHLELLNESHMHAGPATDSHFNCYWSVRLLQA
jgi:stress-induced morphogen